MQALIEIEGRIVVTDILTERFCCDLAACRGMCCVEGQCRRSARKGGTRRSGERIRTVQSLHDRRGQTGGCATGVFRDRWGRGLYHAPDRGCRLRLCLPGKRHDSLRHRKGMARRPYRFFANRSHAISIRYASRSSATAAKDCTTTVGISVHRPVDTAGKNGNTRL